MTLSDVIEGEVARGTLLRERIEGVEDPAVGIMHHEFLVVRRGDGPETTACLVIPEGHPWMLHVMGEERMLRPWTGTAEFSGLTFVRWIDG